MNDKEENKKERANDERFNCRKFCNINNNKKREFGEISLSFDLRENIEVAIKREKKRIKFLK